MKKVNLFLISLAAIAMVACGNQTAKNDFSGEWNWVENNDYQNFSITLTQDGNNITGIHSAVADGGRRMDDSEETSIVGTVSNGIATVKITSGYSLSVSEVTIKFIDNNKIEWTVTEGIGERYFPDNAVMTK